MPEPTKPLQRELQDLRARPIRSNPSLVPPPCNLSAGESVTCERCGTAMFRMHAVWRCPTCRFKTDCCGW